MTLGGAAAAHLTLIVVVQAPKTSRSSSAPSEAIIPIYLILAFCLISDPKVCKEIRPDLSDVFPIVEILACQVMGERIATEWVEEHPNWRLESRVGLGYRRASGKYRLRLSDTHAAGMPQASSRHRTKTNRS